MRTVAELCVRLDGLPLAIELAAARTFVLSPQMILMRLMDRLSPLHWPAQDLPARQQTLHAAIAWSYDLLSEVEQSLFRRLGVFVGGFNLEAAETLVEHGEASGFDVVESLTALVAGSLVLSEEDGADGRRFRLLESMRDYALDRLAAAGERDAARRVHALYFVALAERAEPELRGREQRDWFLRLEQEHENLRAALQCLADAGDGELELRLAAAAGYFWPTRGYIAEGRQWVESALKLTPNADPHLRLKALNQLGDLLAWPARGRAGAGGAKRSASAGAVAPRHEQRRPHAHRSRQTGDHPRGVR